MRTSMMLMVCLLAWPTVSLAIWIDVEGIEPSAFEESPLGVVEVPWSVAAGTGCPNDDSLTGHVYEGLQSALIPVGTNVNWNDVNLGEEGWYEFMFYDDMSDDKNVRVGVHYAAGPYTAPRLGALAVETNQSLTHYIAHRRWGFAVTGEPRSLGWHKMQLYWYPGGVDYYVDGTLAYQFSDGYTYTALSEIFGAPYSTNSPAWVDSVPEPATLALLLLGGLAMLRYRARGSAVFSARRRKTCGPLLSG